MVPASTSPWPPQPRPRLRGVCSPSGPALPIGMRRWCKVRLLVSKSNSAPAAIDLEVRRLEQRARQRLSDLDGMLRRSPQEARAALETILAGPLTFEPIETADGPRFRIAGSAVAAHLAASPGGIEQLSGVVAIGLVA